MDDEEIVPDGALDELTSLENTLLSLCPNLFRRDFGLGMVGEDCTVVVDGLDLSERVWIGRSESDLVTRKLSLSFSLCIVAKVVIKWARKRARHSLGKDVFPSKRSE